MSVSVEGPIRTRDAILAHAVALASIQGLEGLSIGRLAARLAMSKSGVFRHFGSKQELQLATVERASALFRREVMEPAAAAPPGLERLHALIGGYLSYLERDVLPGGCFFSAAAAEFDGRPGPVRDAIAAFSGEWGTELESQASIARDHGELPADEDAAQLAFELGACATRANTAYQLHGDRSGFDRARAAMHERLGLRDQSTS